MLGQENDPQSATWTDKRYKSNITITRVGDEVNVCARFYGI